MAKKIEGGVEVEEYVDLSPEAQESKKNLQSAGARLLDKGRIQAIVERYRERNVYVRNVQNNRGEPIPLPAIVVTDRFCDDLEAMLVPIIEDACDDADAVIARKAKNARHLNTDSRAWVEALATALPSLRGNLVVPPTPSR
jgi:hypothetical protein